MSSILKRLFSKDKQEEQHSEPERIRITKKRICEIFGIEFDGVDEEYRRLRFSKNTEPGDIAVLQRTMISPFILNSKATRLRLGDTAMEKGAKMLLTTSHVRDYPCLIVPSPTIDSLTKLVHELWKDVKPLTLEVTGSYGKTTVVSMLESVLGTKHKVFGHDGDSLNMVVHTVYRVQDWDSSYDVFLQEAAEAIHAGVPEVISKMIIPDICLVTNVGTSHMEYMGSQEAIFESCIGLQEGMAENGTLVLNGDDPFLWGADTKRRTVYYGMENEKADYRAVNVVSTEDGICFDVIHDGKSTPVTIPCVGTHNAQNAAGVFAVAKAAGMSDEEIAYGLSLYHPKGCRQRLLRSGKYHFYLDCYNASIESTKSAIRGLKDIKIPPGGRRIAVISDIGQAGEFREEYHRQIGDEVAEAGLDILICYGENKDLIKEGASQDPNLKIYSAEDIEEVERLLESIADPDDMILLKGSHSTRLYKVSDDLCGTWFGEDFKITERCQKDGLEYELMPNIGSGYISGSDKRLTDVTILSEIDGMPITGIGKEAFKNSGLKTVHIPDTIRNIRKGAFSGCADLKEIKLPESVMYIDDEAFKDCKGLREITLSENVKYISDSAFDGCRKVTFVCPEGSCAREYAKKKGIKVKR